MNILIDAITTIGFGVAAAGVALCLFTAATLAAAWVAAVRDDRRDRRAVMQSGRHPAGRQTAGWHAGFSDHVETQLATIPVGEIVAAYHHEESR